MVIILAILIGIAGFHLYLRAIYLNHPSPSLNKIEKLVGTEGVELQRIGYVESDFLYTPKNYGVYTKNKIFVVSRYLGIHESAEFNNQYLEIYPKEAMSQKEKESVASLLNSLQGNWNDGKILSKHKVRFIRDGQIQTEEWFYKILYLDGEGERQILFISKERKKLTFFIKVLKK